MRSSGQLSIAQSDALLPGYEFVRAPLLPPRDLESRRQMGPFGTHPAVVLRHLDLQLALRAGQHVLLPVNATCLPSW